MKRFIALSLLVTLVVPQLYFASAETVGADIAPGLSGVEETPTMPQDIGNLPPVLPPPPPYCDFQWLEVSPPEWDCIGVTPPGCYWEVDAACYDQARKAYSTAIKDANTVACAEVTTATEQRESRDQAASDALAGCLSAVPPFSPEAAACRALYRETIASSHSQWYADLASTHEDWTAALESAAASFLAAVQQCCSLVHPVPGGNLPAQQPSDD